MMRERRERCDQRAVLGGFHLHAVTARELAPCRFVAISRRRERLPEQRLARRKVGKPRIVEIASCEIGFRYAPRGSTDGADAHPLIWRTSCAEPDDANGH